MLYESSSEQGLLRHLRLLLCHYIQGLFDSLWVCNRKISKHLKIDKKSKKHCVTLTVKKLVLGCLHSYTAVLINFRMLLKLIVPVLL